MKSLRVSIINETTGEIVGDVQAPEGFFYGDAFLQWQYLLIGRMVASAMERATADMGGSEARFRIRVMKW